MNKFIFIACLLLCSPAFAEITVIVHPSNGASISKSDLDRIFLGKLKSFPNGESAVPVNQSDGSAVRDEFQSKVLNKSSSQMKAYWSKLVFTGKGAPPKEVASDAEVINLVKNNPNIIGYIAGAAPAGVKVIGKY